MPAQPHTTPPTPEQPMTIGDYAQQQSGTRPRLQVVSDSCLTPPGNCETTVVFEPVQDAPGTDVAKTDDFSADQKTKSSLLTATYELLVPHSGLYRDRQPSVADIVRRARRGNQVPAAGFLRTASTTYGYGAAGAKVALRTAEWVIDRPGRLGLALLLLALASAFPATRLVLVWLLTPFSWAHDALATD